jgi:DNA polymerase-3 subunit epsilon
VIIFYDSETSDVYNKRRPEIQPRLASLAAIAFSEDGKHEIASFYALVKPDGWTMSEGASRTNGLTTEFLMENGMPIEGVLLHFLLMFDYARLGVAFNKQFDDRVIADEVRWNLNGKLTNPFDTSKTRCAMMAASGCMKMPNRFGYEGYAWPKLGEAYWWLFQKQLEGAHNALNDVRATAWLTFALRDLNYWNLDDDKVLL